MRGDCFKECSQEQIGQRWKSTDLLTDRRTDGQRQTHSDVVPEAQGIVWESVLEQPEQFYRGLQHCLVF